AIVLIADPANTRVGAMVKVRNASASDSMIQPRIKVTVIGCESRTRSNALVGLQLIGTCVRRSVEQWQAIGVRPERVAKIKAGLIESTASGRSAIVGKIQDEIRIGVVDASGSCGGLDCKN